MNVSAQTNPSETDDGAAEEAEKEPTLTEPQALPEQTGAIESSQNKETNSSQENEVSADHQPKKTKELRPEAQIDEISEQEEAYFNMDLEDLLDVVVSSTKTEQTVESAPSIVVVINQNEIRRRGYKSVGEAIRSIAGIAIVNDLVYTHVGIRGIYSGTDTASDTIKLMINSQPVSFRPTNGNFFGTELIPIDAVKRIEVVRGPGSAVYGANAFLGVINVITFEGEDYTRDSVPQNALVANGGLLFNESRTNGTGGGSLLSGYQKGNFQYFIAGAFNYANRSGTKLPGIDDIRIRYNDSTAADNYPTPGWDPWTNRIFLDNYTSENDLERVGSVYGIASYNFDEHNKLTLDGHFQYFDRFGEFQGYSNLTHENRITYMNWYSRLRYILSPEEKGFGLLVSAAVAGGKPTDDEFIVDYLVPSSYRQRQFGYISLDGNVEASYHFSNKNIISLGVDSTLDWQDLLSVDVTNRETGEQFTEQGPVEDKLTFFNLGVFSQALISPLKGLGLTAGARMDYNNQIPCDAQQWDCLGDRGDKTVTETIYGHNLPTVELEIPLNKRGAVQLSLRAAAVYELPFGGFYAKVLYGSSFKPPSPYQLYHNKVTVVGSRGYSYLKPQSADTFEFLLGNTGIKGLHLSSNIFLTFVDDMVVSSKEGEEIANRNADVEMYGLEAEAKYKAPKLFSGYVNMSYLLNGEMTLKQREGENDFEWGFSQYNTTLPLNMYPDFMMNFGVNFEITSIYLNIHVDGHLVGKRSASLVNNSAYDFQNLHSTYEFDPYVLFNTSISTVGIFLLKDRETIFSISVYNLATTYNEPGYGGIDIPRLGPSLYFKLVQQF